MRQYLERWICDVCRETIEARNKPRGWLVVMAPYPNTSSSLEVIFCEKHGGDMRDALFRLAPETWPRELGPGCTAITQIDGSPVHCELDAGHADPHGDNLGRYRWNTAAPRSEGNG